MKSVEKPRYISRTIAAVGGAALFATGILSAEVAAMNLLQIPQPHFLGLNYLDLGQRDFGFDAALAVPAFFNTGSGWAFLHYAKTNKLF